MPTWGARVAVRAERDREVAVDRAEPDSTIAQVQCLVPADLPPEDLVALEAHFAGWSSVSVQVERRGRDRRRPADRRVPRASHDRVVDRRRVYNRRGRRVADRRADARRLEAAPPLPPGLIADAGCVSFWHRSARDPRAEESATVLRLVVRYQSGDEAAFHELYGRFFDRLYSYLRTALRDEHEAEDATQEVFIRALRGLPRYQFRGAPFEAWLFRIARNYAINHKERTAPVAPQDPAELERWRDLAGGVDSLEWMSDADLLGFIGRMPLAQRQVIVLRYMVGFDWDTIAAILDRSSGAVRQLEQRAFAGMRSRLEVLAKRQDGGRLRFAMRRRRCAAPVTAARRMALFARSRAA